MSGYPYQYSRFHRYHRLVLNQISSFSRETHNEAAKVRSRIGATANTRPRQANRTDAEAIDKFGLTSG